MDTKQIKASFAMGVKDAENTINNQEMGISSLDNMIHYHALKKTGDPSIMNHTLGSFNEAKNNGEIGEYDIMEDPYMRKYTYMSK
jgi:hypothetical protein